MKDKENISVVFIHNSITWYRIPFFVELDKIMKVKFLFTKVLKGDKQYEGINTSYNQLNSIDYEIIRNKFSIAWDSIKYIMKEEYDIALVTVLDDKYQTFEAIVCSIIAKIRKKKVAYFWERWDTHCKSIPIKNKLHLLNTRLMYKILQLFVDVYIVPGRKAREYALNSGVNDRRVFIAPNASSVEQNHQINIRDTHNIGKEKKVILYFGRILKFKGLDVLIKAFSILEKNLDNVFLLICGDGDFKEECVKLSRELNIQNICFVGAVQPELRGAYYSQSNLFVLPNKGQHGEREVWGLSTNEAMGLGKPIITTTSNGAGYDLIINNFNGHIVKPDNVEELNNAMYDILFDSKKEARMGENSKAIIESNFTYECMAKGFKEAFIYPFKCNIKKQKEVN